MDSRRTRLIGIISLLVVLLAACSAPVMNQPQAGSTVLRDSKWVLTSLAGGSLIADTRITLRFGADSLDGSAGCNTYGATYAATQDSLRVEGLYWTEMGCAEPEGILEQELAYLNTLDSVASYRIDEDRLLMFDEGSTETLVFAAPGARPPDSDLPAVDATGMRATIQAEETLVAGTPVEVTFTLTNTSDEGLYVLRWFTPLEGLAGDIFRIDRDGTEIPYRGKLVKRAAPTAEDYVWLEAGESVSAEIDLAEGYDFSQAGHYTVQFRAPRISHTAATVEGQATSMDELMTAEIQTEPIGLMVVEP